MNRKSQNALFVSVIKGASTRAFEHGDFILGAKFLIQIRDWSNGLSADEIKEIAPASDEMITAFMASVETKLARPDGSG